MGWALCPAKGKAHEEDSHQSPTGHWNLLGWLKNVKVNSTESLMYTIYQGLFLACWQGHQTSDTTENSARPLAGTRSARWAPVSRSAGAALGSEHGVALVPHPLPSDLPALIPPVHSLAGSPLSSLHLPQSYFQKTYLISSFLYWENFHGSHSLQKLFSIYEISQHIPELGSSIMHLFPQEDMHLHVVWA